MGRTFRVSHGESFKGQLNIRAEFQNIFNRMFLALPSNTNPQAPTFRNSTGTVITSGYGYVNVVPGTLTFGAQPRSGQIGALHVLIWSDLSSYG
jgi:hypothetical protein